MKQVFFKYIYIYKKCWVEMITDSAIETVALELGEKGSKIGWRSTRGKLEWRVTSNRLDNNPQMDVVEDFSISLLKQKTQLVVTPRK